MIGTEGAEFRGDENPPDGIEDWLDEARDVYANGLDLGVRRRVGIVRSREGRQVVTSWNGHETEFPNHNPGWVRALTREERVEVRRSIEEGGGTVVWPHAHAGGRRPCDDVSAETPDVAPLDRGP